MDDIYTQIDAMFSDEGSVVPGWAQDILNEIRSLREAVEQLHISAPRQIQSESDRDFYDFVRRFREAMMADINRGKYPGVKYGQRVLGVDNKGYLYDKDTGRTLSTKDAFGIYRGLYDRFRKIKGSIETIGGHVLQN